MKIPTFVQEQNMFPGMANRTLEKKVLKVFLGFKGASKYFKEAEKHVVSGNPISARFEDLEQIKCREKIGIDSEKFMILIVGGSLGAQKINECALDIMKAFKNSKNVEIVVVTGKAYYEDMERYLKELKEGLSVPENNYYRNVTLIEYTNSMENYMGSADLIIGRSGALTVSELAFLGKPSIFIPSPNVTNNHQFHNAEEMANKGAAIIVEEKNIGDVLKEVKNMIENENVYNSLLEKGQLLKGINGAEIIVEIIKTYVN